jgi:uncharacterized caspase-like protein
MQGLRSAVRVVFALAVAPWLLAGAAVAEAQGAREEARTALVIGNSAYRENALKNPVNDARAMATTLRDLGFTVLLHENASKKTMETAVIEFGRKLAEGGVGFFYYAGHGLQVRGRNYLVPVDAEIDNEAVTRVAAVDVELLLEQMAEARNRVNIVILDACRNNPFERKLRGGSRGLAAVDAARGTLVAYATSPGATAADGDGTNGLYTEELLQALRVPGLKVEEVFKRVRVNVTERSKGTQTPWESSSLTGDLVVNVTVNVTNNVTAAAAPPPAPGPDRESLFWSSIKDGTDPAAFQAYLRQYPDGTFAPLAKQRLASLAQQQQQQAKVKDKTRFDGTWDVTVHCPPHEAGAGYTMRFFAEVKDGMLLGSGTGAQYGGTLTLRGRINPDGTADIDARGTIGDPKYTTNRSPRGAAYGYRVVEAHFDESRGSGQRVETRPCSLTFVK